MTHDSNYELSSSNELDFNSEEPSSELDNNIAEFELSVNPSEGKSSRFSNKRNFLAKKKIEQLQEDRRLKKLDQDYYDDLD
jgi:hypothetical protein